MPGRDGMGPKGRRAMAGGGRHRHRFHTTGPTGWQRAQMGRLSLGPGAPPSLAKEQELAAVKPQAASLEQALGGAFESRIQPAATAVPRQTEGRRPASPATRRPRIAVVDKDRCAGCIEACPDEAISVNGIAAVDPRVCTGCGSCVPECPNQALALGHLSLERGAAG